MASCPAQTRETKIAFGYKPQSAIGTPNLVTEMWSLTKTNSSLAAIAPVMETNADDIGKGDEFPSETFKSHVDVSVPLEKYVSSEIMAWLFCFATGQATKTAAGTGFTYAAIPSDPVTKCLNLPPFTYAEQIRTPPDSVVDRGAVGCVLEEFTLSMKSGPGRANCTVAATFVGTGQTATPSAITPWPLATPEHFLNAASATINIMGIDYVLAQSFISLEFGWKNNVRLDTGIYPGSGVQNGFAIRGRMEYGNRVCTLHFVARAAKGSQEYVALLSQAEGPATITLKGAAIGASDFHGINISIPRMTLSAVVNGDDAGIVTVDCTAAVLKPTDGITPYITMSATTLQPGILGLEDVPLGEDEPRAEEGEPAAEEGEPLAA